MVGMILCAIFGATSFALLMSAFFTYGTVGPVSEVINVWLGIPSLEAAGEAWWIYIAAHGFAAVLQMIVAAILLVVSRLALLLGI